MTICLAASLLLGMVDAPKIEHVLVLSVDGMRPELLSPPIAAELPGLARLLAGPHTLQARTDTDFTVTLPNHIGMATSRLAAGPDGHGWMTNVDPPRPKDGGTIEAVHGSYVPSMFDVASDRGVSTAVIATKTKFVVFEQSYGADAGAPDLTGEDDGRDKVDVLALCEGEGAVAVETLRFLRSASAAGARSLALVHVGKLDEAGHASGWMLEEGSPYRQAASAVDQVMEALLTVIDADPRLAGRVAIIMTSDHGGGVPLLTHTELQAPENFSIPFAVWMGSDSQSRDLYELNPHSRGRPERSTNPRAAALPPIRNSDAGNLALDLLCLPAIEGSTVNAKQDLRVVSTSGTTAR